MNPTEITSQKRTARYAGICYLLVALIAPFGIMYVPGQIIVWGDTAATAINILDKEFLFRLGIADRMIVQILMLLVVWYLYRLLKEVNEHQARLMVILYIVAVPISFLVNTFNITALALFKGQILQAFSPEQLNDLGELFLRLGSYDTQLVQLFWGLWLLPFGLLVYQSGFIPKIFGILIFINGVAYMVLTFTIVLFPDYSSIVHKIAMPFLFLGEIPIIFWLLIVGVRSKKSQP
jgi:hypothetical protein